MAASGLGARLGRAFLLQAAFIGAAAVIGVFLASLLLEGVLIRQALREEAAHFWLQRERDGEFPLPGTLNLTGYLDAAPPALSQLPTGYHDRVVERHTEAVVHRRRRGGQRLYLVFDRSGVGRLAAVFSLLPLAMVLLVLYLSTWFAFRASRARVLAGHRAGATGTRARSCGYRTRRCSIPPACHATPTTRCASWPTRSRATPSA